MGGTVSTARGVTREQLLQSTQSSRDFISKLFQVMITKLTPEDFMKLSKSQTCSSFVFLMADSIGKIFDDLRIRPKRDRDSGIVFFQKVDTLRAQTAESRQLCLIIAYFYIRIFQIFGALAMTVIDDPSAGAVLGVLRYQPGAPGAPGGPRGPVQVVFDKGRIPGARGAMLGGADSSHFAGSGTMRKFLSIKDLLNDPETYSIDGEPDRKGFQFIDSEIRLFPSRADSRNLYLEIDSGTIFSTLELSDPVRKTDSSYSMAVKLRNFKFVDASVDSPILTVANAAVKTMSSEFKVSSIDGKKTWYREGRNFVESLEDELAKVVRRVRDYIAHPEKAKGKVVESGVVAQTDVGVPRGLVNQYIIQTLKGMVGYKATSFCVARALQLLDANSLYQPRPMESTSGICTTRFDALPISVPESKKAISSVPGLKALDQLYYVNPHIGPKEEVLFDKVDPDYANFLSTMTGLFGSGGAGAAAARFTSIDSVLAKDPNCAPNAIKHYLRIQDPKAIQKVLAIVQQLFAKQLDHTKKVLAFFKQTLFVMKKSRDPGSGAVGSYIEIHPRILQGGLDELAKISKIARDMLVDYYKGCEELYQKGVQEVLSSKYTVVG